MVVNSDTFQAIILNRKETQPAHKFIIDNKQIKTTNSIKLLGIFIDDQLEFNEHSSILCSKPAMQLNVLSRLQKYMGKSEKQAVINSFILSNFNYCTLVWHFSSCESIRKIEKIQKRYLRIIGAKCRCKVYINMLTENILLFCIYLNLSSFYIYL